MAKSNANATVGKAGTYDVTFVQSVNGELTDRTAKVNVTPEGIAMTHKAIALCLGTGKDGKKYSGAHRRIRVALSDGRATTLEQLLYEILRRTHAFPTNNVPAWDAQTPTLRNYAVNAFTAALETCGAIVTTPARGGKIYYHPNSAPTTTAAPASIVDSFLAA